jgi:ferredoxin like protein
MKRMEIDDLLAVTHFDSDDYRPHIVIDKVACRTCVDNRACTYSCPAVRYAWNDEKNEMDFDHVGCLECGNCRLVCSRLNKQTDGYSWAYPVEGKGVIYRQG